MPVSAERDNLINELMETQRQMLRGLQAHSAPVWQHLELTVAQIKSLFILGSDGPMTVGQVAVALEIGRPAASVLIDRLVHGGLVDRREDPADRRRAIIHLTARGEALVSQLRQGGPERFREALQKMSDDDLHALLKGTRALAAALAPGATAAPEAGRAAEAH